MRLGLCLAAFGNADLNDALSRAAGRGDLALDVPTDTTLRLVDAVRCADDRRYVDDVAKALTAHQVHCVSNSRDLQLLLGPHGRHTDGIKAGDAAAKRRHAMTCAEGTIRLAERVGAPTVRIQPGCPDFARWLSWWGSDVGWDDNLAEFRARAKPLVQLARDAGVRLLLEPHPKQIVYDRASVDALFAANPDWEDVFALCVDPANLAATGHDPIASIRGLGSRIAAAHAKDLQRSPGGTAPAGTGWSRYGPQPPIRFRALGLGELDWPGIVEALAAEGFDGVLYVEHEDVTLRQEQGLDLSLHLLRTLLAPERPEGRTW